MALTPTQEAQVLQLVAEQAALLSLADNEATIISKLGATKVNLSSLGSAATFDDDNIMLIRQGTTDLSIAGSVVKAAVAVPDASETVKGKVELATAAETQTGTSTTLAVHPAGLASAIAGVGAAVSAAFSNLKASATGLSALVTITADELIVRNGTSYKTLTSVSVTPSLAVSGVNGIDTGTSAANTWYSVWLIWDGATTAGLLSLSATAPTMPAGYTHKARVGWVRSDGSANKYPLSFMQYGRIVQYKIVAGSNVPNAPIMATGAAGDVSTPTLIAVSIGAFVPSTAARISGVLGATGSAQSMVAPNNSVGNYGSLTNPPTVGIGMGSGSLLTAPFIMSIETSNIYWASSNGVLACYGWEDNL